MGSLSHLVVERRRPIREFQNCINCGIFFQISDTGESLAQVQVKSALIEEIKAAQGTDSHCQQIMSGIEKGMDDIYRVDDEGLLRR